MESSSNQAVGARDTRREWFVMAQKTRERAEVTPASGFSRSQRRNHSRKARKQNGLDAVAAPEIVEEIPIENGIQVPDVNNQKGSSPPAPSDLKDPEVSKKDSNVLNTISQGELLSDVVAGESTIVIEKGPSSNDSIVLSKKRFSHKRTNGDDNSTDIELSTMTSQERGEESQHVKDFNEFFHEVNTQKLDSGADTSTTMDVGNYSKFDPPAASTPRKKVRGSDSEGYATVFIDMGRKRDVD